MSDLTLTLSSSLSIKDIIAHHVTLEWCPLNGVLWYSQTTGDHTAYGQSSEKAITSPSLNIKDIIAHYASLDTHRQEFRNRNNFHHRYVQQSCQNAYVDKTLPSLPSPWATTLGLTYSGRLPRTHAVNFWSNDEDSGTNIGIFKRCLETLHRNLI